jgi:hypothetical protein
MHERPALSCVTRAGAGEMGQGGVTMRRRVRLCCIRVIMHHCAAFEWIHPDIKLDGLTQHPSSARTHAALQHIHSYNLLTYMHSYLNFNTHNTYTYTHGDMNMKGSLSARLVHLIQLPVYNTSLYQAATHGNTHTVTHTHTHTHSLCRNGYIHKASFSHRVLYSNHSR